MNKILEINDFTLSINEQNGNQIVNKAAALRFDEGDFVLITGKNGSGKSTFYYAVFGLSFGTDTWWQVSGDIRLYGIPRLENKNILGLAQADRELLRASICFVGQNDDFQYGLKAYQCLEFPADVYISNHSQGDKQRLRNKLRVLVAEKVQQYLAPIGLGEKILKHKTPQQFSGGQKKLIHILSLLIKAEITDSPIILMDEPLNNLDVQTKRQLNLMFTALRVRNPRLTVFVITHCRIFQGINKELKMGETIQLLTKVNSPYNCLE